MDITLIEVFGVDEALPLYVAASEALNLARFHAELCILESHDQLYLAEKVTALIHRGVNEAMQSLNIALGDGSAQTAIWAAALRAVLEAAQAEPAEYRPLVLRRYRHRLDGWTAARCAMMFGRGEEIIGELIAAYTLGA